VAEPNGEAIPVREGPSPPSGEEGPAHAWIERHLRGYERGTLATLIGGAVIMALGLVASNLRYVDRAFYTWGMVAACVGLLVLVASLGLTLPVRTFRTIGESGGSRYDRLRHWTQLKSSSILLNMLTLACGVGLLFALLSRIDVIAAKAPFVALLRLTTALALVLVLNWTLTHYLSLRVPMERLGFALESAFFILGLVGSALFALLGLVTAVKGLDLGGLGRLKTTDAPFFLLAGAVSASFTLFVARSLPTVYALFTEERDFYKGRAYMSKSKSVILPAMVAFALLFLVVLMLLVFGIGVVGFIEETQRSAILLGVLLLIVIAMGTSIAVAFMLAKSEDKAQLILKKASLAKQREYAILGASGAVSFALLMMALVLFSDVSVGPLSKRHWIDFFAFALLAGLGPYGFYFASRQGRRKRLEERFPDFLRDIAASSKAGLTLTQAAVIAAKGEYGALSPEIVKMADQLSWNVPFDESLQKFGERVNTPLVQRAVNLITEASHSGGHVTDVLMAAARDVRELKNLENERKLTMSLYTVIIYITFFVFLGVAATLYGQFVPEIINSAEAARAQGSTGIAGLSFDLLALEDYRIFYYMAGIMQGLGNGMVAGLMGTGKGLSGLRHSFLMVLITYMVFTLLL
jgi:pilus assembly protein TadC